MFVFLQTVYGIKQAYACLFFKIFQKLTKNFLKAKRKERSFRANRAKKFCRARKIANFVDKRQRMWYNRLYIKSARMRARERAEKKARIMPRFGEEKERTA